MELEPTFFRVSSQEGPRTYLRHLVGGNFGPVVLLPQTAYTPWLIALLGHNIEGQQTSGQFGFQ